MKPVQFSQHEASPVAMPHAMAANSVNPDGTAPDGRAAVPLTGDAPDAAPRDVWPALWKGWRRKCPNCGKGPVLSGYLKVRDTCAVCRQELFHHRADDGPAYLTILIVGHIMAPMLHVVFTTFRPEPLVLFTIFAVGTIALSLYLLPRIKGAVVAFQWARRVHGFGGKRPGPGGRGPAGNAPGRIPAMDRDIGHSGADRP